MANSTRVLVLSIAAVALSLGSSAVTMSAATSLCTGGAVDRPTRNENWANQRSKPEASSDCDLRTARNGKILYTHNVGGQPIAGGVMTYNAAGHQNVAIISGYVGYYNLVRQMITANMTISQI